MTLKEIAIELLEKYEAAESGFIWEYSSDIRSSEKSLKEEIKRYRKMIDKADRKTENSSEKPNNCETCANSGSYKCTKCDGEMYFKTEAQTDCPKTCPSRDICTRDTTDCAWKKGE